VGFTATSLRRRRVAFASLVAADVVYIVVVRRVFQLEPVAPTGRLLADAIGALAAISVGYTLFILFVTATRYLRALTELAVAHEMHSVLVPPIVRSVGGYEYYGWSIASGEVGSEGS